MRYATKTAAAVSARKVQIPAAALLTMATLLVLSAVLGFAWNLAAWWPVRRLAVATLGYLAYLRRQTRIEEQLRRRRM